MGLFSWCTSDTRKSISCTYNSYAGAPTTVYLLNPFGEPYKESDYEGYGEFGGHDVYDLVAEWNRKYLTIDNLRKPVREHWASDEHGREYYEKALKRYEQKCLGIVEFAAGASDEYMQKHYGTVFGYGDGSDWKRCLGIDIACYDEEHVKPKYPIKLVEVPVPYEEAEMSPSCPFQGYFYDESLSAIQEQVDCSFAVLDSAKNDYFKKLKGKYLDDIIKSCEAAGKQPAFENKAKSIESNDKER